MAVAIGRRVATCCDRARGQLPLWLLSSDSSDQVSLARLAVLLQSWTCSWPVGHHTRCAIEIHLAVPTCPSAPCRTRWRNAFKARSMAPGWHTTISLMSCRDNEKPSFRSTLPVSCSVIRGTRSQHTLTSTYCSMYSSCTAFCRNHSLGCSCAARQT